MLSRLSRLSRTIKPVTALSTLAVLATAACGSLSGNTDDPSTLATIHGTIESQSTAAAANLATAIVWYQQSHDGTAHESADSVPVSGSFPASFSIDLTAPPPPAAMMDLGAYSGDPAGAGVHFAFGLLVAYDDLNHNGALDLVAAGAPGYVDSVEGFTTEQYIAYFDKPVPEAFFATSEWLEIGLDGSRPPPGYSFASSVANYCYATGDAGSAGACAAGGQWKPIDTPVTLTIGATDPERVAQAQNIMCTTAPNGTLSETLDCGSGPCPPVESVASFAGPLPSSNASGLICLDSTRFQYDESCTTTSPGVCLGVTTTCTQQVVVTLDPAGSPAIAPPADWPCALQPPPAPAFLDSYAGQPHSASGSGGS